MTASEWVWTLRVFDHVDLHASDYAASVRFYETVLSPLGIPKIEEHEQGTWSSAWTDFTNLNVKCGAALTGRRHGRQFHGFVLSAPTIYLGGDYLLSRRGPTSIPDF
jgi:hypothetical protein